MGHEKHNTTTCTCRVLTAATRLASVDPGRTLRQCDNLLLHHNLALPEVRQDCHSDSILDLLQNANDLTIACLNFQSKNQDMWLPSKRDLITLAVYPRVFEILTTFCAKKSHCVNSICDHHKKNETTKTVKHRHPRVVSHVS